MLKDDTTRFLATQCILNICFFLRVTHNEIVWILDGFFALFFQWNKQKCTIVNHQFKTGKQMTFRLKDVQTVRII